MQPRLDQISDFPVLWDAFKLSRGRTAPHPPQVVPLLLEEADGHSRRFSLHHGSHEGEHTTRITFSSPVVPWGRQNCPATQLRRRRWGGHTLGTQLTSGFLPGFSEASHQQHRSWATAWISPHLSVLMPSILPPLNHLNSTQNLANCWLFTKHIYKHSFKENSHGCKWQELRLLHWIKFDCKNTSLFSLGFNIDEANIIVISN